MASYNIHLAIGKRYIAKRNDIQDISSFIRGLIEPDLTLDKSKTHYTLPNYEETLITHLQKKVGLYEYIKSNPDLNDYTKGVFLHLITDYLFFNYFINKDYLEKVDYQRFCADLYYSYKMVDKYLLDKYEIDYQKIPNDLVIAMQETLKEVYIKNVKNIIILDKLNNFIEYVSSIDLDNYAKQLKLSKKNVLP